MRATQLLLNGLFCLGLIICCEDAPRNKNTVVTKIINQPTAPTFKEKVILQKQKLTEENAIDFFYHYKQKSIASKVKITTKLGSFTIQLYDNVPYHKANFLYLTEQGYFKQTQFHRVVKDFIIQGGNSDDVATAKKRSIIGSYLLPPDAKKGYKHTKGTVSMPSSEINNPHMLASPYEFFIVVANNGAQHLNGDYTPFGKVIEGMDVVDLISNQPVEEGDWPVQNIFIQEMSILD